MIRGNINGNASNFGNNNSGIIGDVNRVVCEFYLSDLFAQLKR
jgi:hypothetical protein